jgi:hypothetical protein
LKSKQTNSKRIQDLMARHGACWLATLMLAGLACLASRPAAAQSPAPQARVPEKTYMAKNAFRFPVVLDKAALPNLKEMQLFVREGAGGTWALKQTAAPSEGKFECHLDHDGEYWFSVVTVDKQGKSAPEDVSVEPPNIIVVVDTQAPRVDLKLMSPPRSEGICVSCDIQDANPNAFQTHFEYQTGDEAWRTLEPMQGQLGSYCVPSQAKLTGLVRVTAQDMAGNTASKVFNLTSLEAPVAAQEIQPKAAPAAAPAVANRVVEQPKAAAVDSKPAPAQAIIAKKLPESRPTTVHEGGKWPVVSSPAVSLEYKIEAEGTSGVSKVEVWITRDSGRSWSMLTEDKSHRSPVDFTLPEDGVYGIRLVAANGWGFGGAAPSPGDAPDRVIEVDTTKPQAELGIVKLGPPGESPFIEIPWQADDRNLGSTPVELFYSPGPNGPWTPIAKELPGAGSFKWYPPRELGDSVYVSMIARDRAGNWARCQTIQPVTLDDKSRPRATIISIEPANKLTPPVGN